MRKAAITKLENMLNEEKERLEKELDHFESILLVSRIKEGGEPTDDASDTSEDTKLFVLMERVQQRLIWVEESLDKVRKGKYGICQGCGEVISIERLMAKPEAKFCIQCRQQIDGKKH